MRLHHILLVIAALARTVAADPNTAKADQLFNQGRSLLQAGKLAQACDAFDASQKLAPATTTLFNQADCREKNGQLATAWKLFNDGERATRGAVDSVGKKLHQVALDRAAALEPRLSHVTISAPADAGLVVKRDDVVVPAADCNRPLPIDAGTYTFSAMRGDRPVWSETMTIGIAGDDAQVAVVEQKPHAAPNAAIATTLPGASAAVAAREEPPPSVDHPSRTTAWLATGGAAVLLGGALAFDLWGNSTYDSAVQQNSMDLWSSANDKRYTAEGLLLAGVACGGLATYLWLHGDGETKHAVVTPVVAPGAAGVQLGGRW